jgi:hypothetical protein
MDSGGESVVEMESVALRSEQRSEVSHQRELEKELMVYLLVAMIHLQDSESVLLASSVPSGSSKEAEFGEELVWVLVPWDQGDGYQEYELFDVGLTP